MSLVGFGVKNLRCLTDTGIVALKPITLLVGKNSSGKSTFLRAFPLLRQSVENPRSSPILWNHKDYVDFGSIEHAINARATDRSVSFVFAADLSMEVEDNLARFELTVEFVPSASGPYVRAYEMRWDHQSFRLTFDEQHRLLQVSKAGGEGALPHGVLWLGGFAHLIASLHEGGGGHLIYKPYVDNIFQRIASARTSWPPGDNEDLAFIIEVLEAMDKAIAAFVYGVAYLGPQRAVADRDYRLDEGAVEEVDPRARNMANYLASLSPAETQSFSAFTRKHLGFEIMAGIQGVHVEILVKEPEATRFVNIADVGFGYAEVLPLCAVLWASCVREPGPTRRQTSLVALEQPELHLHPAHQARLPRMLVGALVESRRAGREVKLMVETHSDAVVNQLGMLVRAGKVSHEDVQILFFDQDPVTRESRVVVTGYEPDGVLRQDWPFGFLVGALDELDGIAAAAEE